MENVDEYADKAINMSIEYGPKLVLAIVVLVIGLSVIKSLTQFLRKILDKRNVDPTLTPFLLNLVNWTLKILLLVSVASMVGIATTSFVAVLGAAGLAIGLALQGSLSNFAGGVLILMFKPFVKDDHIEAQQGEGIVEKIDIYATVVRTFDNKKIVLPNGPLIGGRIINHTANPVRRVNLEIGIGYNDDIRTAIKVLVEMCHKHEKVLNDPETTGVVTAYGDSSINLLIKTWCNTEDFWTVYFELMEEMKYTLDANNISIPFPQRDVHLINQKQ